VPGVKTNERPGTRAVLRHYRMSAYKAREVLDVVRGRDVDVADEILRTVPREAARVVAKVLSSAVSNARNNDGLDPEELYISACYADEGSTLKRWRPRARGRATRIRKRTCHITVIVSRLPDDRLERRRARQEAVAADMRSRRVAASRRETGRARRGGVTSELENDETSVVDEDVLDTDTETDVEMDLDADASADDMETTDDSDVDDDVTDDSDEVATDDSDDVTDEAIEVATVDDEDDDADAVVEAPKRSRAKTPRARKKAKAAAEADAQDGESAIDDEAGSETGQQGDAEGDPEEKD
jgi:large subunit ribosomal protein L22